MKSTLEKYNIRDTKKHYCDINNKVLSGLEIITCKANTSENVSHIKKQYMDHLLKNIKFSIKEKFDKELKGWTISVNELNLYGEGATKEEAIEDLLDSILEFAEIYLEKVDLYSKVESIETQIYMLKVLRCQGSRDILRKELGLQYARKI